ncbi:MAG TPA: hypothetical protein VGC95_08735 [Chitinophagaceae bacterium]|jgi:hypothetical protein
MATEFQSQTLQELSDIRKLMQRSSRFLSLSGLSGVAAGVCGLCGAYAAVAIIDARSKAHAGIDTDGGLENSLMLLGGVVFIAALSLAFLFTWKRAKRINLPVWDLAARNLLWNLAVPLLAGGLFILSLIYNGDWEYISPACLVFYGLGLVNASKYTVSDIRYLGYLEIVTGLLNLWMPAYAVYFWAAGFGVLHIVYGLVMWAKYEKDEQ